jgi:predicted nucleotidyltransferase
MPIAFNVFFHVQETISKSFCIFAALNYLTEQYMKTKNEILHLLSLYKPTAQSKYGLTRLGIFGSVARNEHTEDSDVDVCYEGRVPTLLTLDLIQTDLEKLLESRVDLVRIRDGMNGLLKQRIQKEGVYV